MRSNKKALYENEKNLFERHLAIVLQKADSPEPSCYDDSLNPFADEEEVS